MVKAAPPSVFWFPTTRCFFLGGMCSTTRNQPSCDWTGSFRKHIWLKAISSNDVLQIALQAEPWREASNSIRPCLVSAFGRQTRTHGSSNSTPTPQNIRLSLLSSDQLGLEEKLESCRHRSVLASHYAAGERSHAQASLSSPSPRERDISDRTSQNSWAFQASQWFRAPKRHARNTGVENLSRTVYRLKPRKQTPTAHVNNVNKTKTKTALASNQGAHYPSNSACLLGS